MVQKSLFRALCTALIVFQLAPFAFAEDLMGGNYVINGGSVNTISGTLTGGSYVLQSDTATIAGVVSGGGYSLNTGYTSTSSASIPPVVPPSSGGGGGGGGGAPTSVCPASANPEIVLDPKVGSWLTIDPPLGHVVVYGSTQHTKKTFIRVYPTQTTAYVFNMFRSGRLLRTCSVNIIVPVSTVPTITPTVAGKTCRPFTKRLKIGSLGVEVRRVQSFLQSQGYQVDRLGVYGVRTERAVLQFQKKYLASVVIASGSTSPTGLWYEFTMKKANEITGCKGVVNKNQKKKVPVLAQIRSIDVPSAEEIASCLPFKKNLEIGSIGAEVRRMQKFLIVQGYELDALGIFGPKTKKAVEKFQSLYSREIIAPANSKEPSGLWYEYTRKKANKMMGCAS